jgi:hypothetical protein
VTTAAACNPRRDSDLADWKGRPRKQPEIAVWGDDQLPGLAEVRLERFEDQLGNRFEFFGRVGFEFLFAFALFETVDGRFQCFAGRADGGIDLSCIAEIDDGSGQRQSLD